MSENKMPSIVPGLKSAPVSPTPVVEAGPKEEEVELNVPSHEDVKPVEYIKPGGENNSIVQAPKLPSRGVEVIAVRKGYYNQTRIDEGEKFYIKKMEDLGQWMKCVDPLLEKKRLELLKNKKAK